MHRGVVDHAQEFRQHRLPDLLRERLSFLFVTLPVSFQPVPQHLMEKDRRRAPAQDRRPIVRLRHRRFAQRTQVRRHPLNFPRQLRFVRQSARIRGLKCLHAQQVHAVLGARLCLNNQPHGSARRHDRAPLAGHHPRVRALRLEHHGGKIHFRIFPERSRKSLDLAFPRGAIEWRRRFFFLDMGLRLLLGKVRRLVLFLRANRRVGPHVHQRRHRALVFPVREFP